MKSAALICHAHTIASDGSDSIEAMAAAQKLGYDYVGISDHSHSLKIARGVSVEDLWDRTWPGGADRTHPPGYGQPVL